MKHFFRALVILVAGIFAMAFSPPAKAQTAFESKSFYDTAGKSVLVTSARVGKVEDIFGVKGWNLEAAAIGGIDQRGTPLYGMAFTGKYQLAKQAFIDFGPAYLGYQSEKPRLGILFGFSITF